MKSNITQKSDETPKLTTNGKRRGRPPKNMENKSTISKNPSGKGHPSKNEIADTKIIEEWDPPEYISQHSTYFPNLPPLAEGKGNFPYELTEDQITNINDIASCVGKHGHVIISAEAGTGKTTTVCYFLGCMRGKYKRCIVICPDGSPGIIEMWQHSLDITGASDDALMRYGTLRSGKSFKNPDRILPHGLLRKVEGTETDAEFFPTDKLAAWAEEGLAVIFDESHNGNNNSLQSAAMLALLQPVFDNKDKCAVFLVSYTVCYNAASIPNILAYLGYADDPLLLAVDHNKVYASVYNDCIAKIKEMYPKSANMLDLKSPANFVRRSKRGTSIDRKLMGEHLLLVFDNYIRKDVACAMKKLDLACGREIKNVFYMPLNEDRSASEKLVLNLSSSELKLRTDGETRSGNREAILHDLETIRIKTMLKNDVMPILKNSENDKVIIMVKHISSINFIKDFLNDKDMPPLIVTGEHTPSKDERREIVSSFQEHNNKYRILIGTSQILSTGCSLDDTHGGYKRWLFICPSFRFCDMAQSPNRVYRRSTKSKPTIIFVYLDGDTKELKVLVNMKRKELIMEKTVAMSMTRDMPLLPADLPCQIKSSGKIYVNFNSMETLQ